MKTFLPRRYVLHCSVLFAFAAAVLPANAAVPGLQQQIPAAEYAALVDLYNSTQGPNWIEQGGWNDPAAPSWLGVTVDGFQYDPATGVVLRVGTVSSLILADNRLIGSLPASLGNLGNLATLDLQGDPFSNRGNRLSGSLPATLGHLLKLNWLGLSDNQIGGSIPDALGNLAELNQLYLSGNQLSGSIPASLGNLSHLKEFDLRFNQLTGSIPDSIGNLTELGFLSLDGNQLTGTIPESLGNLINLQVLTIRDNALSGAIPTSLGNLVNLLYLELLGNQLSGTIPESLGNLSSLNSLQLGTNQLTGSIPETLGNLVNLGGLNLSHNQLVGPIPTSLGNLQIGSLYLQHNRLSGSIPQSFVNMTYSVQRYLDFSDNQLGGDLPDFSLMPVDNLYLYLNDNCFAIYPSSQPVTIIEKLLEMPAHFVTYLPQNAACAPKGPGLKRQIPPAEYDALLDFYSSTQGANWYQKDGWTDPTAPYWFGVTASGFQYNPETDRVVRVGTVTELSPQTFIKGPGSLVRNGNNLRGSIPESLGALVNLEKLDLTLNELTGSIPVTFGNLLNLKSLELGFNQLSGSIPDGLANWVKLQTLDLHYNQLSGPIPDAFDHLMALQHLDLAHNQLSGLIPASLAGVVGLKHLELSYNELSGTIPSAFGTKSYLNVVILNDNRLRGGIPDFTLGAPLYLYLNLVNNCFDVSPGSEVQTMASKLRQAGYDVGYVPQRLDCGTVGDLNNDGCVDQLDLSLLLYQIRIRSTDLRYDLNGDGKVDVADARFLVLHFTNQDGSNCP